MTMRLTAGHGPALHARRARPARRSQRAAVRARARALSLAAFVLALLALVLPDLATAQTPPKEGPFQSTAPHALLLDDGTGAILYEKAADEPFAPASMTKIMTAAVVFDLLRQGQIRPDTEYRVSENSWRKGGAPSGSSAMFAALGSRIKVEDLLRGLIVQAGNDAAMILAEGTAGSEAAFAGLMNKKAQEIGMTKSYFVNASGLPDPQQRVTARDLATLARYVITEFPQQYALFSEKEFTWNKIRQLNRNPLIGMDIGADGLSTGYTEDSGYSLTASAVQNGQRLIMVVGGLKTLKDRTAESRRLLEWGFRSFESRELFAGDIHIGTAQVFGGVSGTVPLIAQSPVRILVPRGSTDRISARIVYRGPLVAPVEAGKDVARLRITRGDIQTLEVPLYTQGSVARGNLPDRALDAAVELSTGFVRRALRKI